MKLTRKEINLFAALIKYSERYEINFQFWPDQKTVYIAKDGIDLTSFSSDNVADTLAQVIEYLNRINRK